MKSRRVYFQTFPPAGQWAGAVGRGEGWWSVAGTDEVDKPRVPLPCDPAWGSWPPTPDSSHPPHPRQAYLGQHCPPPSPSQWGGRQTRPADLDRSLALSTETLFSATARVRPTLEVAYALQYLWASEHSRTVIVLITDTQDMFFGGMTLPEYKPRAEYP